MSNPLQQCLHEATEDLGRLQRDGWRAASEPSVDGQWFTHQHRPDVFLLVRTEQRAWSCGTAPPSMLHLLKCAPDPFVVWLCIHEPDGDVCITAHFSLDGARKAAQAAVRTHIEQIHGELTPKERDILEQIGQWQPPDTGQRADYDDGSVSVRSVRIAP